MSENERPTLQVPERLTEEELAQLAVDIDAGKVFITNTADGIRFSFGLLLGLADIPLETAEQIGALYGPVDTALSRSINGYPFMTTMRLLHVDDREPLDKALADYKAQREAFVHGGN